MNNEEQTEVFEIINGKECKEQGKRHMLMQCILAKVEE
jgi:hypothetical protein